MTRAIALSPLAPQAPAAWSCVAAAAPAALSPQGAAGANQAGDPVARHLLSERPAAEIIHSLNIAAIETRRRSAGVRILHLCEAAAVPSRSYVRWRQAGSSPARPVLQRLDAALDRLARGAPAQAGDALIASALTLARLHIAPAACASAGPGRGGRGLAEHAAIWFAVTYGGVRRADLARHLGRSRAAVTQALDRVAAQRAADPAFDAALAALARAVSPLEDNS